MAIVEHFSNAFKVLSDDPNSQLVLETKTHRMKLAPKYQGDLKTGISCHLRCFLSSYSKE